MTARVSNADLVTRREAIRRVSALFGGAVLVGQSAWLAGCAVKQRASGALFSDADVTLLDEIARTEPSAILRDELHILLDYTVGGMPKTPIKFSSYLKHHKLHIVTVSRSGKSQKGVPVKCASGPRSESAFREVMMNDSSDRICFHARVRSRKLMKNGAITSTSIRLCRSGHLRAFTPMKYASG